MIRFLLAACAAAVTLSSPAHAAYEPGTVGYLYTDCAYALESSKNPKEFLGTYCGGFVEGYGMGVLVSNSVKLGEPNPADPCADAKKKEYERINARLCRNLPDYRDPSTPPGTIISTVAETVFRWQEQLKKSKEMKIFKRPVADEINSIIAPGKFCEKMQESTVIQNPGFVINPGLLNANWFEFVQSVPVTLQQKAIQCSGDLQKENFPATRCGAEIVGFIAGLYSMQHLQERESSQGACAKEIDRLYESLDMPGKMCVDKSTAPADVARAFLARTESMKKARQSLQISGFGGAGYQSIYYGFLCKKQDVLTPIPGTSEN